MVCSKEFLTNSDHLLTTGAERLVTDSDFREYIYTYIYLREEGVNER